ncbi:MAG: hypothetical protein GY809_32460, partial [Planctomycetes bacterium]|nr:hypothetical protein [Planctomycetota bacterium]
TDLTGLEAAVSLRSLNLRYNHVTDVSPLKDLNQLVKLDLSENELSDLSGLAALTQLGILDVHHNGVTDLTPLSGLRELWSLTLRDNGYQGSLSALSSLRQLEHLDLDLNGIQNLDDLEGLTRLKDLRLASNEITDVSALANITELETLDLRHNSLNSISALTHLTHLERLFLEGNSLGSQALADLQTIKDNNPGIDIDVDMPSQANAFTLSVTSSGGGIVTEPGEGNYGPYASSTLIGITARPDAAYNFVEWTGSAVDAGKVVDAQAASTSVTVDSTVTVTAIFAANLPGQPTLLFVDDNAPEDPLPGDMAVSDALEDGSAAHPFDSIQEAIDLAADGFLIQVAPGTYFENIDFLGKAIELGGMEPNDPNTGALPVLQGFRPVPTVRMGDDVSGLGTVLRGMAVMGAKGTQGGTIECTGGASTLINCLVTGNYTSQMRGGAVLAVDCNLLIMNSTIAHNTSGPLGGGIVLQNSQMRLLDSIVWGNTPAGIRADATSVAVSEFSDVQTPVPGPGNITEDPLFVKSGAWVLRGFDFIMLPPDNDASVWLPGDSHLKSQQGHWDDPTQAFVLDDSTSPCIDAGSELTPIGQESDPHGERLNQGVFGGTVFASRTHSDAFHIPDENLKTALMDALGIWWEPTAEDLMWVTTLYFELPGTPESHVRRITDITGLEAAVSLRSLNLRYNLVTDVSSLQNLNQLVKLDLSENELSDLSGLETLTQLGILDVHHNNVTDLTPLSGLRGLWSLTLRDIGYEGSLSALSSLTRLEHLDLDLNGIQDLDDLATLTRLTDLRLFGNDITDVSVLVNLTKLETLDLRDNALTSISALTHLMHLERLFLDGNPLGAQALADLQIIQDNNPGIDIDV